MASPTAPTARTAAAGELPELTAITALTAPSAIRPSRPRLNTPTRSLSNSPSPASASTPPATTAVVSIPVRSSTMPDLLRSAGVRAAQREARRRLRYRGDEQQQAGDRQHRMDREALGLQRHADVEQNREEAGHDDDAGERAARDRRAWNSERAILVGHAALQAVHDAGKLDHAGEAREQAGNQHHFDHPPPDRDARVGGDVLVGAGDDDLVAPLGVVEEQTEQHHDRERNDDAEMGAVVELWKVIRDAGGRGMGRDQRVKPRTGRQVDDRVSRHET